MTDRIEWVFKDDSPIPKNFQSAIGGDPIVAKILYQRGINTIEAAMAFLNPAAYQPTAADAFPDIQVAYQLLADSIQNDRQILVWGDFDVDGQTSTTVLVQGLRALGGNVSYHIPIRAKESHGIRKQVLLTYIKKGFELLITCDTGITEHENIEMVRAAGIPVIVTDHHTLGETLPPANAVINPQRLPEGHPLRTLPGVGVTYKLIEGLYSYLNLPFDPDPFLELTALGIVADVAELKADTRYLLQKGLYTLQRTQRLGLQTLYEAAEVNPQNLRESHIGFQIAPQLNAVGRLSDANPIVEFLLTDEKSQTRLFGSQIEAINSKRRFETRQVQKAAEAQLQSSTDDRHAPAIILYHPNWPGGIVGIVASHLVERYHKPVILLTGDDPIHGSARSIEGLNITELIASQANLLTNFGGHPMAAGLSMPKSNYDAFKSRILKEIGSLVKEVEIVPTLQIDQTLGLSDISLDFVEQIERLAPFGAGFPRLQFMIQDLNLVSHTAVGQNGEHRQVTVEDAQGNQQRVIWWNGGDSSLPEATFDLVCTLSKSDFQGKPQISVEWIDFRLSEQGQQEVATRHFEIIDFRGVSQNANTVNATFQKYPDASVWLEGEKLEGIDGLPRHQLGKCKTLIIYTTPPSQSILEEVIHATQPQHILVFGQNPKLNTFQDLMQRVAGLAKYAINNLDGQSALDALAAACSVDHETIRASLKLWQAKGKLNVKFDEECVHLSLVNKDPDQATAAIYERIVKHLLDEINAYRAYFNSANIQSILKK